MASFYGRQQTADRGTTQAKPVVAGPAACLKSCEKVMSQCLVDATTFMEKERCRDRYDLCSGKCGTAEQPTATEPTPTITSREVKPATTTICTDADCVTKHGAGWHCENGVCVPSPRTTCVDADCVAKHGAGWHCENGYCVPSPNRKCGPGGTCPAGYTCMGGYCVKSVEKPCVQGNLCTAPADCGGKACVGYDAAKKKFGNCDCTKSPPKPGVCVEGATCTDSTQCAGEACINGKCHCTGGGCKDDAYCIKKHGAGWYCYKTAGSDRGICKNKNQDCPESGPEFEGCTCGKGWATLTGKCPSGYKFVKKDDQGSYDLGYKSGAIGQCECLNWIKKGGDGNGGGDTVLGEYQWPSDLTDLYGKMMGKAGDYLDMNLPDYNLPPELQALLDKLLGRANEYIARKPGYSQSALEAQFGKGYENIRNLGTLTRQQTEAGLQKEGMLGTGAGQAALRQIPWQTEKNISDVVRDVFLGNEEQKRKDLEAFTNISSGLFGQGVGVEQMVEAINAERRGEERDYTGIANQLFGTGMTYNQLQESINAARRGEGQNALAMWMQYIMSLMSSWKA